MKVRFGASWCATQLTGRAGQSFGLVALLLAVFACGLVGAEIVPDFPEINGASQPIVVNLNTDSGIINGTVLPCDVDYFQINTFSTVEPFEYLVISFNQTTTTPGNSAYLWVVNSNYTDLQNELQTNTIIDTLGGLPGPFNYEYECIGSCVIEINCAFTNGTYYLAVGGQGVDPVSYQFEVFLRETNGTALVNGVSFVSINVSAPVNPPFDRILNYNFYYVDIPSSPFYEYEYMTVLLNLANVQTTVRIMYDQLPIAYSDSGVIVGGDPALEGDNCVWDYCVNTAVGPTFTYPVASQPRIPCDCVTTLQTINGANNGFTCQLTVDPCSFAPGTWYISVDLPAVGTISYQLVATVQYPLVTTLVNNVTVKGAVEPEQATHYKIVVPSNQVVQGQSHFFVQVSNVRGGTVQIWVHRGLNISSNVAGGPETCAPANATCTTAWACNLVVEKCYFVPGTWYVSVNILYNSTTQAFLVDDPNRLPISFTIRATWVQDAAPIPLLSGVPVSRAIGEALYDFYVVQVPPTVDTWLYVELFVLSNDTEVILAMLQGSLPGGNCYSTPDFYCLTGDNRGIFYNTGPPNNTQIVPTARQSCTFTIQACELQQGPLYLSVYGQHYAYADYGNNTYYQNPVQYTLSVNFEVASALTSAVSLVDTVIQGQYNHYYMRADFVDEGSYMAVEATNIQHGQPHSIQVFINYNYLAGACPCYDQLYNCTGSELPSCNGQIIGPNGQVLTDPETVTTYCQIVVPSCAFRSGVWYISVQGVTVDNTDYTTPIGYTLTATIFPAPVVQPLVLGLPVASNVAQWNLTYAYSHFKLGAAPVPLNDLIFTLNYLQSPEFLGKHDNSYDQLELYVSSSSLASSDCYSYTCTANIASQSYCTIVVPHCEWVEGDWFVAVRGDYDAVFPGRFTLLASTKAVQNQLLISGIPVTSAVPGGLYQHYFIDVINFQSRELDFEVYTNGDQDAVSVYVNVDERAGDAPCFRYLEPYSCLTQSWCSIQIQACELAQSRYYVSVYGVPNQFYEIPVEYTLTANLQPIAVALSDSNPITGYSIVGQFQHYSIVVSSVSLGQYLLFSLDNVKHGTVEAYRNVDQLAGTCPCYSYIQTCIADSDNQPSLPNWCELRVPSCQFVPATYYFSVWGLLNKTPSNIPYLTQIGYTLEVSIVDATIITDLAIAVGRDTNNTRQFEFIGNGAYRHYQVTIDQTQYEAGYHVIVEITNVIDGALYVFFNDQVPSDENPACQVAQLCTSGLGAGDTCYWQIPYCLTSAGVHYISVEGITGSLLASYDILVWLQAPDTINENSQFVYPIPAGSTTSFFELNVTHAYVDQPYGWAEFVNLNDVTFTDQGDILEVFFYNIVNNVGEPTAFNVYIFPEAPAGAHGCCSGTPAEVGSCENAPCSYYLSETTSTNFANTGDLTPSYTCDTGAGVGGNNGQGNFGGQCNVTVWACDVAAAGVAGPATWWVTIVPITQPTASQTTNLTGLSYSVQWRVRSTRVDSTGAADSSTDLTSLLVSATASQVYSLPGFQEWMSFQFTVTIGAEAQRLIVQTTFSSGTGIVYINAGSFASALDCNIYNCPQLVSPGVFEPIAECGNTLRYVNSSCCLESAVFYVSVRNTDPTGNPVSFSFFITDITVPSVVLIDTHPSFNSRYNTTSQTPISGGSSTFGVVAENYDHYELVISDSDYSNYQSLVMNFSMSGVNTGQLTLFVRKGAEAGTFANNDVYYNNLPDGCYDYEYTCTVGTNANANCTLQIPHCQLVSGNWYISVYNPDPNYSDQDPALDYFLEIYFDQPIVVLTLAQVQTFVSWNFDSTYVHYMVTVTPTDIGFTSFDVIPNYVTNWLRFEIGAISGGIPTMFINYDDVAGNPYTTLCTCYNYLGVCSVPTSGGACYVDVLPCTVAPQPQNPQQASFKLISGNYFIGVNLNQPANYSLGVFVLSETYQQIDFALDNGEGDRQGTVNYVYSVTPSQPEISNSTDFWFYVDTSTELSKATVPGSDYFIANLTINQTVSAPYTLQLNVWANDCNRWTCTISDTLQNTFCVIDAVDLAPCSQEDYSGYYYFHVNNPNNILFTLYFYHNESTLQTMVNNQTITDIIYPYEYEMYFFNATNVGQGETLLVTIDVTCGDVEAWISYDTVAGPGRRDNQDLLSCSVDYCSTAGQASGTGFFDGTAKTCTMFLDTCLFVQMGYWITIRGVDQSFAGIEGGPNQNLYLPIKYQINILETPINYSQMSQECSSYVSYSQIPVITPTQFYVDLETVNIGTQVRFGLWLPSNAVLVGRTAQLTVSYDGAVGYDNTCYEFAQCAVASGQTECSVVSAWPAVQGGRYFLWADAPRGSQVLVEVWDPYIPIITNNRDYPATINGPSSPVSVTNVPFTPSYQFYRANINYTLSTFLLRVFVFNVQQGSVAASINNGYGPYSGSPYPYCSNVNSANNCTIEVSACDIESLPFIYESASILYVTIEGLSQECELHSIQYTLNVQVTPVFDTFITNSERCDTVNVDDYHFYNLIPQSSSLTPNSILSFNVYNVDVGSSVDLLVNDGQVASETCNQASCTSSLLSQACGLTYICGYNQLQFAVHGNGASLGASSINYGLNITRIPVNVTTLTNGKAYTADNAVNASCPHPYDFYVIQTNAVDPTAASLVVVIESEFAFTAYVNKRSFGWSNCFDTGYCSNPTAGVCNIFESCNYENTNYYITVSSQGPYTILATYVNNNQNLTLNAPRDDSLPQLGAGIYSLYVNQSLIQPDTRLLVTVDNVNYGNLRVATRYGGLPGFYATNNGDFTCYLTGTYIYMAAATSNTGYIIVNPCDLVGGLWYIGVQAIYPEDAVPLGEYTRFCHDIEYTITAQLVNLGISPITAINVSQSYDKLTLSYYGIDRYTNVNTVYNYYTFTASLAVSTAFGQVRVANVTGGYVALRVKVGHLATDLFAIFNGTRTGVLPVLSTGDQQQSGSRPYTVQEILEPADDCGGEPCILTPCDGCADACCYTGPYTGAGNVYGAQETSCALYVESCEWHVGPIYIVVQALSQWQQQNPITYSLIANEYRAALQLTPNEFVAAQMNDDNWEYQFYSIQQPTVSSLRVRVQVAAGEGVYVGISDAPCLENSTYYNYIWCPFESPNIPFLCDIDISTRAAHPGASNTNFYINVYGSNATYALTYYEGRENCHEFQGLGVTDGLNFCAGLVPYATWRWTNYTNLDNEAQCLFEELYEHFRVQPCWNGVTGECNFTLQRFACYETFHRCDQDGFAVGTCRSACDAVVYECVNWFESVDLEHYNCTSSRYIDEEYGACTGRLQDLDSANPALIDDPYFILYEASSSSQLGWSLSLLVVVVLATLAQVCFVAL